MSEKQPDVGGVDMAPPPLPTDPPPPAEERRKSLTFTSAWSTQPSARKYSLNDLPHDYKEFQEEIRPKETSQTGSPIKSEDSYKPQVDSGMSKDLSMNTDPKTVEPPLVDKLEQPQNPESNSKVEPKKEIVFAHKDPKPVPKSFEKAKKIKETPAGPSSNPPTPNTAMKMSCMEEEAIRERLRTLLLRQTAQILEAEGVGVKFTRDTFRRTFLNKVAH